MRPPAELPLFSVAKVASGQPLPGRNFVMILNKKPRPIFKNELARWITRCITALHYLLHYAQTIGNKRDFLHTASGGRCSVFSKKLSTVPPGENYA